MDKVRVIKRSLLCHTLAWFSLLPLVGLLPAIISLLVYRKISGELGSEWNPAGRYALWGLIVALVGLLVSLLLWGGLLVVLVEAYVNG